MLLRLARAWSQIKIMQINGFRTLTDVLNGTLTLNAPTSTEPGLFTGTITFTVG